MDRRPAAWTRHASWCWVLSALAWNPAPAFGAGFEVSPIRAEVLVPDRVADFELRNSSTEPVTVQVDVLAWQQDLHEERLAPATGVMVVPRIVSVAPGQLQRIRVALRDASQRGETAYRVHFREVPPPPPAGFVGVRTALKMDVPLFFRDDPMAASAVDWHVRRGGDGRLVLAAHNRGARHANFSGVRVTTPAGAVLADMSGPRYVLSGARREWPLRTSSLPAPGTPVRLVLQSGSDEQSLDRTIE